MKNVFLTGLIFLFFGHIHYAQEIKGGEVISQQFLAASIQNNKGGEDAMRNISIYLQTNYNTTQERYPTIYFLHGFATDDREIFYWLELKKLLDKAIENKKIRPVIFVVPNSKTKFGGSFYTNSTLTGNWSDFIAKDVVEYIDKNYRTLPNRENRGLSGHSMGGNGALEIAMLNPEVFSIVYALSPSVLDWSKDFTMESQAFKRIFAPTINEQVDNILNNFEGEGDFDSFYATVLINMGRAYSPSDNTANFGANYPITYDGDIATINEEIKKNWEENFPTNMIDTHLTALRSYKGIKIEWGRNEEFNHIPTTALAFSKKLEANNIEHFAEEYMGDHVNKLGEFDGRIYMDVLPFFEIYLDSQTSKK